MSAARTHVLAAHGLRRSRRALYRVNPQRTVVLRAPGEILRLREGEQACRRRAGTRRVAGAISSEPPARRCGGDRRECRNDRNAALADLARPHARLRLGKDPRLVLRGERAALGLLDQLRVRHTPARRARRPRIPARLRLAGLRGRRRQPQPLLQPQLHSCSSPTSRRGFVLALKVIDSSMVSVSPDVDREGPLGFETLLVLGTGTATRL